MPASLATLLTFTFILALLAWDVRRSKDVSSAVWLPVLWMLVAGSRFPSQWLALGDPTATANVTDGSSLDAAYFSTLILCGFVVLARRHLGPGELFRLNFWVMAFLVYGFVSILWSDFHFIAFKRWVKTLGHPVMALIILTEPDPVRAFRSVMKRCAFVLLPLSVLFIKYLPEYGRGFSTWTGEAMDTGVGLTKNDLGYVCMVFGIFFIWSFITASRIEEAWQRRLEQLLSVGFLVMVVWLLFRSDSMTSLVTMCVGGALLFVLGWRVVSKRYIGAVVVVAAALGFALDYAFDIYEHVVLMLGRDLDLTDRTQVWADVIAIQPNVLLGAGFESFWLGERLEVLWAKWWWRPSQAHNGYIETYLNLGLVGLVLLVGMLVAVFRKIGRQLVTEEFDFARLRFAFFFAILLFNYTEAGFKAVHFVWTIFDIIAMEYSRAPAAVQPARAAVRQVATRSFTRREGFAGRVRERTTSNRPAMR